MPQLPPELDDLRLEVRHFLEREYTTHSFVPSCDAWMTGYSPDFSRRMAERGWIGMTWPRAYGGSEHSALERFVVTEELLAAGAPVAAHWIADRQTGPLLLHYGSEYQRSRFLPVIARGECYFSIGMSEPDSGSDLASIRTAAVQVDGGWTLNGRKVWMSLAHHSHYSIVLCRTSPRTADRHAGLSQLIVDLASPGVSIHPIRLLNGDPHFNEVVFDDVFVPGEMLVGQVGSGWSQVISELAFERSGPERFLSTFPLLVEAVRSLGDCGEEPQVATLARLFARLWPLRRLSISVAGAIQRGDAPVAEAALVKEVGTRLEGEIAESVRILVPSRRRSASFNRLLSQALLAAPGFTLRGGTSEILRGIIAKSQGSGRTRPGDPEQDLLERTVTQVFRDGCTSEPVGYCEDAWAPELWRDLEAIGVTRLGIPEEAGGSGGTIRDVALVLSASGRFAAPVPLAETILAGWVLARAGLPLPEGPLTVANPVHRAELVRVSRGWRIRVEASRVPWARMAASLVLPIDSDGSPVIVVVDQGLCRIVPGRNLAGEPRDEVTVEGVLADEAVIGIGSKAGIDVISVRAVLGRTLLMGGALERLLELSVSYAEHREQFGRPIARFQAIQHQIAHLAGEVAAACAANENAVEASFDAEDFLREVAVAKIRAGEAAGTAAAIAHQIHGAVGMTADHPLHQVTRRLWSWRDEDGDEAVWSQRLGRMIVDRGADRLWETIASRPRTVVLG